MKFLNPFSQKYTRFTECQRHVIAATLLNFEYDPQSNYLLAKNAKMGLGPAAFLPRSKTALAAVSQQLDSMAAESVITTTDISKSNADKPIMIH